MLCSLVMLGLLTTSPRCLPAGDCWRCVSVDDTRRSYLLHMPPVDNPGRPLPVVLAFHGGGRHAAEMVRLTQLNRTADSGKFIAVYPNGSGWLRRVRTWNAGIRTGYAVRHKIDDVNFVDAILDDLAHVTPIDPDRIYATGISNGAMFCYRLATELPERIAAIAPVAGGLTNSHVPDAPGVSVIHFHGTEDRNVPYGGGVGPRSLTGTNHVAVEHYIRLWADANGWHGEPEVQHLPTRVDDGTSVTRTARRGGMDQTEVVLYTIHGGGHTWPGGQPLCWYTGRTTQNVSANQVMWDFFQRHPKRGDAASLARPEGN